MANVGNKGKFSDRLKRMKLIRYAKKMKLKVGEYINFEEVDNSNIKRKVIGGTSVGIAVVGAGISNLLDKDVETNKSVENRNLVTTTSNNKSSLNEDSVDNSKLDISREDKVVDTLSSLDSEDVSIEKKETISEVVKRKTIETASVGTAIVGAIGSSLLSEDRKEVPSVDKLKSKEDDEYNSIQDKQFSDSKDDIEQKEIDFGNNERKSFQRVFKAGDDIILIDKISDEDIINGDKKTYLASQIVKKIKREYEKKLNEIEVLESELFLLNDKNENELDLEKCREIKKEIEELISKINHIISQYNIYQYNCFLDDMLDIDDSTLVDNISEFKRLYEGAEIQRRLVSDFQLISDYQLLYSRLEDIKVDVENVSRKNDNKIVDYDKRDKRYENMQKQIVNVSKFNEDCTKFIEQQNKYVEDIQSKVSKISVDHITNYRLSGFGNLVGGTLRYLRMMAMAPFISMLPGIAFRNYAANIMVNNLRRGLRLERITSTIYKTENFQFELNDKIHTLDYNYDNASKTLDNVKKLKSEFMDQYKYDIPGYNETLRKINEIEIMIWDNKEKLDLIKNKLKRNKKINEQTLKKCKVLEKESRPVVERV